MALDYGTKLIINSAIRETAKVASKAIPAIVAGDMIIFQGDMIVKPTIEFINEKGRNIKSKIENKRSKKK